MPGSRKDACIRWGGGGGHVPCRSLPFLSFLLAALLVSSPGRGPHAAMPASEIYATAKGGVVAVEAVGADGSVHRGTGFFVAPGVVATNFHIVRAARSVRVLPLAGGGPLAATVTGADEAEADIALLRVTGGGTALPLADRAAPRPGDRVYILGNPRGLDGTFSEGLVSAVRRIGGTESLQLSAAISPGSSGSPVLDGNGRVVAIVRSMLRSGTNLVFATPASALSDLMILSRASVSRTAAPHPASPAFRATPARAPAARLSGAAGESPRTVTFGVPHWASVAATAHILKAMIETHTPHRVELRRGTNAEVFQGMDDPAGAFDVHPEIWVPNHQGLWDRYVEARGTVVAAGESYAGFQGLCTQGFVRERHGVRRIEDLRRPEIARLFDWNGDGAGELWLGAPDWHSTAIYRIKLRDYRLSGLYRAWAAPENEMWWRLPELFRKKIPALFLCYGPHWAIMEHDLAVIEEPRYAPDCYDIKDPALDRQWLERSVARCSGPSPTLHIGHAARLSRKAPSVARLLARIRLDATTVSGWANRLRADDADPYIYARQWVRSHGASLLSTELRDEGTVAEPAGQRRGFGLDLPSAPQR